VFMNTAKFALYVLVSMVMVLIAMPALGHTVTVYAEGVVTEIETYDDLEFDGSVTIGSTMTGSCTYETETPDQYPVNGSVGRYSLTFISMHIGSYTFLPDFTPDDPWFAPCFGIGTAPFQYSVFSFAALFYGPCYLNGQPTNLEDLPSGGFSLMWLQASSASPTGDALPDENTFPSLSVFDEERYFSVASSLFRIAGEVTSVTVVPEPASVLLFGFAGLALLRKRANSGQG